PGQQTLFPGSSPASIAMVDLDGDGKPDLIVANYGISTVSVFRNLSTIGNITFATPVDFETGLSPFSVAMADLDGDGRPDIVTANLDDNTVSVLRNTATPGTIDLNS